MHIFICVKNVLNSSLKLPVKLWLLCNSIVDIAYNLVGFYAICPRTAVVFYLYGIVHKIYLPKRSQYMKTELQFGRHTYKFQMFALLSVIFHRP
jgi:hypothetical protein